MNYKPITTTHYQIARHWRHVTEFVRDIGEPVCFACGW